jgi:uncharacterized protein
MLLVKTSVKTSKIQGIGLFAEQKIPKGTIIWKFDSRFDLVFDKTEVENMPEIQRNLIHSHAYFSKEIKKYIYCSDNARFINHSVNNNIDCVESQTETEGYDIANKDIKIGDELTMNYRQLDAYDEKSKEEYLNK